MKSLGKIILFLSSYSPLYILLITYNYSAKDIVNAMSNLKNINLIDMKDIVLYSLCLLIIIPNLLLWKFLKDSEHYSETIEIKEIVSGDDKLLNYILGYIVTFMTTSYIDFASASSKIIITGIIIQVLLGYLYCKANMLYINPVLSIIGGYHIFIATTRKKEIIILVKNEEKIFDIKNKLENTNSSNLKLKYFTKDIYILK